VRPTWISPNRRVSVKESARKSGPSISLSKEPQQEKTSPTATCIFWNQKHNMETVRFGAMDVGRIEWQT